MLMPPPRAMLMRAAMWMSTIDVDAELTLVDAIVFEDS